MTPTFHVCYFGLLAERRGLTDEQVSHPAITSADLYDFLNEKHRLGLLIQDFRVAVNDEFVPWSHPLHDGDRVALLPPMSGG